MINDYDYDEEIMREAVSIISIPHLSAPIVTPRMNSSSQEALLLDLQKLIQDERLKEDRRVQLLKQKQHTIGEQVQKRLADKDRKIRQLEEVQKRKTYAECTFKPKTISKGNQRSFQQFIQQQQDFTKKIEQKRMTLKKNLETQKEVKNTFQPKTNTRVNQERKNEVTVFDRLYALKDKENDDDGNSRVVEQFHPKITDKGKRVSRNAPIDQLLYKDALRRQEKAKDVECNNQIVTVPGRALNLNNEKYVAQKFIKEYYGVIEHLNVPSTTQAKIDYMLFNQILKEMRFVQVQEENESNHERILIHQAFQLLDGYQVNAKNICVFLLALIGVFHINPVNFQEGEDPNSENELAFDQAEGRKIQKSFDLFKRNRLFSQHSRKEANEAPSYSFKPQINKVNSDMAEKHREQMLYEVNQILQLYPEFDFNVPKDGVITPTDLLVLHNKAKQIKKQCRKDELEQQQMQNCTFKPMTLPQSHAMQTSKWSTGEGSLGQKKSLQLYNFHRQLQSKKQSLRVSRQNEDLGMKECTFAPNLNRGKIQSDTSNFHTKQVEENLYRMKKGREQTQQKKKKTERGELSSLKKEKKSHIVEQKSAEKIQNTPILLLDVNLGNRVERLTLYSGDEHRLEAVAKNFSKKHELDEQNQGKLAQLLHLQIENMLAKIPEDEQVDDTIQ